MRLTLVQGRLYTGRERLPCYKYRINWRDRIQMEEMTGVMEGFIGTLKSYKVKTATWVSLFQRMYQITPRKVNDVSTDSFRILEELLREFNERPLAESLLIWQHFALEVTKEFPVKRMVARRLMKHLYKRLRPRLPMRGRHRREIAKLRRPPVIQYSENLYTN